MKTPYPAQRRVIDLSVESLRKHKVFLSSSETGCGKSIMTVEACRDLELPGLVVCPLAVVSAWRHIFEEQGVPVIDVLGWEKLRTGKTRHGSWVGRDFIWKTPECVIVLDECQRAKGRDTKNSKIMIGAARQQKAHIMCSATAAEDPTDMFALGLSMGLHNGRNFITWALQHGCSFDFWQKLCFQGSEAELKPHLAKINREMYGSGKAGKLTRADLADHFQTCSILTDPMDFGDELAKIYQEEMGDEIALVDGQMKLDKAKAVAKAVREAEKTGNDIEEAEKNAEVNALTRILRMRQRVEISKTPALLELLEDYRREKMSVAVFVNFDATIEAIRARITEPYSIIRGGQSARDRGIEIENFQRNAHKIIICNIAAGGIGVSLHDEDGGHPRASIISPSFNANEYEQVLGRIDRAGSKSPSLQRILIAAGTVEVKVFAAIETKLRNLYALHLTTPAVEVTPSPTMPPDSELVLECTEDHPCGVVVEVPMEEQAKPKKPRATKAIVQSDGVVLGSPESFGPWVDKVLLAPTVKEDAAVYQTGHPAHAEYSPSSLKYYEIAPMYRPAQGTNPAAEMGTRIHLACETGNLEVLVDEERLLAETMLRFAGMIETRHGVDDTWEDHKEIRLTMSMPGGEETFGTCDRLRIKGPNGVMTDYKTGRNPIDDPEINCQTQAYVAGAFQKFAELEVIDFYFAVPVREEILHARYVRGQLPELLLRISTIIKRAKTAVTCNPQPGVCDFCALQATCQQLADKALLIARRYEFDGFEVPVEVHASRVSDPVELGKLLSLGRLMDKWNKAISFHCNEIVRNGGEIAGFYRMAVAGKASVLSTPGAAITLKDELTPDEFLACCSLELSKVEDCIKGKTKRGGKEKAFEAVKDKLTDAGILGAGEGTWQLRAKRK